MSAPTRLLCIDDDPTHVDPLKNLLRELWPKVEIITAYTLAEGIDAFQRYNPDMILTDLHLPDSLAEETITSLASIVPFNTPIVILSGSIASIEGIRFVAMGADAFIGKGSPPEIAQRTLLMVWIGCVGRSVRAASHVTV